MDKDKSRKFETKAELEAECTKPNGKVLPCNKASKELILKELKCFRKCNDAKCDKDLQKKIDQAMKVYNNVKKALQKMDSQ